MSTTVKTDRSSQKTRKAIRQAVMKLLQTKELSKITVREITDTANYSRNTFYTHYADVCEVIDDIASLYTYCFTRLGCLVNIQAILRDPDGCAEKFYHYILEEKTIYDFVFAPTYAPFFDKLRKKMCDYYCEEHIKKFPNCDVHATKLILRCIVSGFLAGLADRYSNGKDPTELKETLYALAVFTQKSLDTPLLK